MKKSVKTLTVILMTALISTSFAFANGASETSTADEKVTLSFMWWGNETRAKATTDAVNHFMAENPSIEVTPVPNPYTGYHDKIILQLANKTAPDMFCYSTQWMNEVGLEDNPALMDLKTLEEYIDLSKVDKKLLLGGEGKGKLLGIPTGISGFNYSYYEAPIKAYMEKSNKQAPPSIDEDWTMDEFITYGADFHKVMGDDYYFIDTADSVERIFLYLLSEYAGNFYIDENAHVKFTEKNVLETLATLQEMTDKGVLGSPSLQVEFMSGSSARDEMAAAGKFGGEFMWTSNVIAYETIAKTKTISMPYPIVGRPENDGIFVRPAQFWSISANTEHPVESAKLLNYILNSPKSIVDLGLERAVPPTSTGREILKDAGLLVGNTYVSTNYLVAKADASYNWFIMVPELMNSFKENYSNMILGSVTREVAAHEIYSDAQSIMSEIQETYNL